VGLNANQKKRLQLHPAALVIILLGLASWVIGLGGVGVASSNCTTTAKAVQAAKACVSLQAPPGVGDTPPAPAGPLQNPDGASLPCGVNVKVQCALKYQMQWWSLFFNGILLVALFVSVFFETFEKGRTAFVSFFVMSTTLLMYSANQFINDASDNYHGSISLVGGAAANNAAAAGYVLLCIWNFCLLISAPSPARSSAAGSRAARAVLGYTPSRPAGPTPQQLRVRSSAARLLLARLTGPGRTRFR